MKDEGDERQTAPPVLARSNEIAHACAQFRRRPVAYESTRTLHDARITQRIYLRLDLFDTTSQAGSQPRDVEDSVRIAVKKDKDIPRQKGSDVALNETRDRGS